MVGLVFRLPPFSSVCTWRRVYPRAGTIPEWKKSCPLCPARGERCLRWWDKQFKHDLPAFFVLYTHVLFENKNRFTAISPGFKVSILHVLYYISSGCQGLSGLYCSNLKSRQGKEAVSNVARVGNSRYGYAIQASPAPRAIIALSRRLLGQPRTSCGFGQRSPAPNPSLLGRVSFPA